MPHRDIRYQAAVISDHRVLLVRVELADGRAFWLLPGGGREAGDDTPEHCIQREVREETGLDVSVVRLLSEVAAHPDDTFYARWRTYLCRARAGEARAGASDGTAGIAAVMWLPLADEMSWPSEIRNDRFLHPQLLRIAAAALAPGEAEPDDLPPATQPGG